MSRERIARSDECHVLELEWLHRGRGGGPNGQDPFVSPPRAPRCPPKRGTTGQSVLAHEANELGPSPYQRLFNHASTPSTGSETAFKRSLAAFWLFSL